MKRFIPVPKGFLAPPPSPALKLPRAAFSFSGGAWRAQVKPVRTAYPGGLKAARGRIVFVFTCFILSHIVFGQQDKILLGLRVIDSLKNILKTQGNDTNKVFILNRLSGRNEILGNYDSSLFYAEQAEALAEKINFKKGLAAAFRNIGWVYLKRSDYQKAMDYQFKSYTLSKGIGYKKGIDATLCDIGTTYYTLGNYSKALEYDFKTVTQALEGDDISIIADVFCNIGVIYEEQGNYSKALEYLFKSLKIEMEVGDRDNIAIDLDNIGGSYFAQGDYPKALKYDFRAVTQAQEVGDKDAIANFLGDIGNIYYKQGDCIRALEYDFKAITMGREVRDVDEVALLYSNTGEVYIKLKNYKKAKDYLDSALAFSKRTGDKKNIKVAYSSFSRLDSALGNYKTAYNEYKIYIAYRDSILNQGATQMEISYEFEKREDSIKAGYEKENIIKTAEIKRKKILNDSAIVIIAFIILVAVLLMNRQQIKRKKDKITSEKERAMLLLENQRMEIEKQRMGDELSNARKALEEHTKNMAEKNVMLEQFKTDMEKIKNLKSKELEEVRIEQLEHLNKTTILTEGDWDKFKELFEQVYKGFLIRLKEKLPDLSHAEIRLACLTKLKLNTKQMADTLGVSHNAIWTIRYRLRKKLNLSENTDLLDIIESI